MSEPSVLIAAWYFPPDGGAGSQRPASFSRHLPDLGWDCRVIARAESIARGRWNHLDASLMNQRHQSAEVIRVTEQGPFLESSFPGERSIKSEIGPFCREVLEEVSRSSPDVLLLTMSPFILSELLMMMPEESRTKVVVDLRDPWILDYWATYSSIAIRRTQHRLMHRMLDRADGIVMNTEEATTQCLETFGEHLVSKMITVENGYEPEDMAKSTASSENVLRIMHAGTFHCESLQRPSGLRARIGAFRRASRGSIDRTGRTPHHLFEAACILREDHPQLASRLRFDFLGDDDAGLHACVHSGGFASQTTLHGYVDHDRMLELMVHADGLFLPGAKLRDGIRDPITPGKTYEYLASGRPIIAALHPGSGLDLVTSCPGVFACDPCCARSIARSIRELADFQSAAGQRDLIEERRSVMAPYRRRDLAIRLSEFMKNLIKKDDDGTDSRR